MTTKESNSCSEIIHAASIAAAGISGFNIFPCADVIPLTTLQVGMIIKLGQVFDRTLTEASEKAVLNSGLAAITGRTASQILASFVPGIGNIINAFTATTLTEGIGWWAANTFDDERGEKAYVVQS